jgi:hypothetical protein
VAFTAASPTPSLRETVFQLLIQARLATAAGRLCLYPGTKPAIMPPGISYDDILQDLINQVTALSAVVTRLAVEIDTLKAA